MVELAEKVQQNCINRNFSVNSNPPELSKTETKSSSIQIKENELKDRILPKRQELEQVQPPLGLFVESHSQYAIQIGILDRNLITGDWNEKYRQDVIRNWHGYQQYAAIARTWLLSNHNDDLNLFLVGPAGSFHEPEWQNFAEIVERNEIVCRKVVWLPSKNEDSWETEIESFIERTFLAQPWAYGAPTESPKLDALSDSISDLGTWRKVLDLPEFRSDNRDYNDLVAELLKLD
ncbi:MAG: hypothetical protein P1V20_09750 [Verrucomicrobiales bacterium]|nr:hypothetical protein [Verrucomicrobiales bacterium]